MAHDGVMDDQERLLAPMSFLGAPASEASLAGAPSAHFASTNSVDSSNPVQNDFSTSRGKTENSIHRSRVIIQRIVNAKLSKGITLTEDEISQLSKVIRFCCKLDAESKILVDNWNLAKALRHVLRHSQFLPDYIPPQIEMLLGAWDRGEYNLLANTANSISDSSDETDESSESDEEEEEEEDTELRINATEAAAHMDSAILSPPSHTSASILDRDSNVDHDDGNAINALRGIIIRRSAAGNISYALNKAAQRPANVIGHNGLKVGEWWPMQICALRDGAHGSLVGGIAGKKDSGAYSVIMSGGHGYEDDDRGDLVSYSGSGARGAHQSLTKSNRTLITSYERHLPVRVIRTHKLKSPYAPSRGFRYDGLYYVTRYWQQSGHDGFLVWKFRLERLPDQDPIRRDVPTRAELRTLPKEITIS